MLGATSGVPRGGWGVQTPTRDSEVLTKSKGIAHLADNV
jgi:hypothetical protein